MCKLRSSKTCIFDLQIEKQGKFAECYDYVDDLTRKQLELQSKAMDFSSIPTNQVLLGERNHLFSNAATDSLPQDFGNPQSPNFHIQDSLQEPMQEIGPHSVSKCPNKYNLYPYES